MSTPISPAPPCGSRKSSARTAPSCAPITTSPPCASRQRRAARRLPLLAAIVAAAPDRAPTGWPWPAPRWTAAAQKDADADALKDQAQTAAWLAYRHAHGKPEEAAALALLGEIFAGRESWRDALNAYRASLDAARLAALQQTYDDLREKYGFRVLDYKVDNESASPRVCFRFSEDLVAQPHGFLALRDPGRPEQSPPFPARIGRFASKASSMANATPSRCARVCPPMSAKICSRRRITRSMCATARPRRASPAAITSCRASGRKARRSSRSTRRRSRWRSSGSATAISCRPSAPTISFRNFPFRACGSSATATARRSGRERSSVKSEPNKDVVTDFPGAGGARRPAARRLCDGRERRRRSGGGRRGDAGACARPNGLSSPTSA